MADGEAYPTLVVSFDVEEHHRIEAAAGWSCPPELACEYGERMERTTRRLVDLLAEAEVHATFFIVGQIARDRPQLVRAIADAGHEVASHGWDHRTVYRFTPASFLDDLRTSKDALEQATGRPVLGYRAPTFSICSRTAWAIDALIATGYRYDSSIFPVRHDRYGLPEAPRSPFLAEGFSSEILELPPATYRVLGQNLPVAGGGYFRLFPLALMEAGLRQLARMEPAVGMLYFHPWEFDPGQPRLPLSRLSRWRTYVGIRRSEARLRRLLGRHPGRFRRAIDLVKSLDARRDDVPRFRLAEPTN